MTEVGKIITAGLLAALGTGMIQWAAWGRSMVAKEEVVAIVDMRTAGTNAEILQRLARLEKGVERIEEALR